MTMLDRMRRHKAWLKWSLGIVVVTFVLLYVPAFLRGTGGDGSSLTDAIAAIDGHSVLVGDYRRAYQQQVDAMRALGTDPIRKLMTPRVLATVAMLPLLTAVSDFVGLVGGFLVAYFTLRLGAVQFWTRAIHALDFGDLVQGFAKPFVFAFIISTVACFMGLRVKGGTQGVGRATTSAVVVSSVILLVTDTFITRLLLWMFQK